jgi:hypothetical protein
VALFEKNCPQDPLESIKADAIIRYRHMSRFCIFLGLLVFFNLFFFVYNGPPFSNEAFAFFVFLPGLLLAFIAYAVSRCADARRDPYEHFFMRALKKYGDPDTTLRQIDQDMRQGDAEGLVWQAKTLRLPGLWIGRQWAFVPGLMWIINFDEVIWVYQVKTLGTLHDIYILSRDGSKRVITMAAELADDVVTIFISRIPWASHGWDQELAEKWKKGREAFIQEVEARKKKPARES